MMSHSTESGLVSVVVPCFNYGRLISETLESLLKQSYHHWECIVIDDGSTDDTQTVVERYCRADGRIRYVYQSNRGLSAARNRGIRECLGAYLQFLDADDMLEAQKLERHVRYLVQHPEIDVVYSPVRYFRSDRKHERHYSTNEPDAPWMPQTSGQGPGVVRALLDRNIMAVNCPLLRRDVISRSGLFCEELAAVEDWEYWIRCAMNGTRFQYLDEPGTYALVRHHSASLSKDRVRMAIATVRMCQRFIRTAPSASMQHLFTERLRESLLELCVEQARNGLLLRGALTAGRVSLSGHYGFAMKYGVCLALIPITGHMRFTTFISGASVRQAMRRHVVGRARQVLRPLHVRLQRHALPWRVRHKVRPDADRWNVLFLIPWMIVGGADRVNLDLAMYLRKDWFSLHFMTTSPAENVWARRFSECYSHVVHLPEMVAAENYREAILQYIRRADIRTVVISHSMVGYEAVESIKRLYPHVRVLDLLHGEGGVKEGGGFPQLSVPYQASLDGRIVVTRYMRDRLVHRYQVDEKRIHVIHNGIDTTRFAPGKVERGRYRTALGLGPSDLVVSYLGRF